MTSRAPLVLPRGLIFLASIWLIASWMIAIGVRPPVQPSSASYTPAVRLMLLCVASGLMIGWPLLRLSQHQPQQPIRQTLLDLVVLIGLVQVVIWPLRLVTNWPPLRMAAIDTTLVGWTILAGAVVASAIAKEHRGPRMLAMAACVAMCLGGPALAWLGVFAEIDAMHFIDVSPLLAIRTLGEDGGSRPSEHQWAWILLLGVADAAAWIALWIFTGLQNRTTRPTNDRP